MGSEHPLCNACTAGSDQPASVERRSLTVALITLVTMAAEVVFGLLTGSMALLADGIHMGTHALALGITVGAYVVTRRWRRHPGFAFGTGKVGVLGAYSNALLLGATAIFMVWESVGRFLKPEAIQFDLALGVAALGLIINLVSALVLGGDDHHDHDHEDHDHHPDSNRAAALAHVLADALTSVLAIGALLAGKWVGWNWLDPAVGILGAVLILSWAWRLIRTSGAVLLDFGPWETETQDLRDRLEAEGAVVRDLHLWQFGEGRHSLLLSLGATPELDTSEAVRKRLGSLLNRFGHVTIEISHGR